MATTQHRTQRYIPELDGIRGLALLMIFTNHYAGFSGNGTVIAYLSGATKSLWCGVDLFFVLSGFLITGILLDARGTGNYFTKFYARRSLRIFPLYFAVLGFTFFILPSLIAMTSDSDRRLIANQGWLWTYTTNFETMVNGRNTAFKGDSVWLYHLWSLAIEEQFYLIWPFVIAFVPLHRIRLICWACFIICPLVRVTLGFTSLPTLAAYEATFARLDSLTLGSLLALFVRVSLGASKPATYGRFKTSQASGSFLNTITDSVLVVLLYFSRRLPGSVSYTHLTLPTIYSV